MRLRPFIFPLLLSAAHGVRSSKDTTEDTDYVYADRIEVSCLSRSIDTGDHIQDPTTGALQYSPFATCNETNTPLAFGFNRDHRELNCTIPFLSDEMFHLLEFYVHHDSPLACRIPARPLGGGFDVGRVGVGGSVEGAEWVPLVFSLAGKLEFSHLHIANRMNVILHLSAPGVIDSATAYSTSPLLESTRIIIGDPLTLRFAVRWYASTELPSLRSGKIEDDEGNLLVWVLVIVILMGLVGVGGVMLRKRRRGGGGRGGIIGNGVGVRGVSGASTGGAGYGEGGYGGFKGVTRSGGYGYGGFSGKRKD
ncbi:uncharacterized protein LAJ45_09317 [Morchella importuna]|uniref:uncharacterized protein n=1 Tax=Morchella importuna TaxID=1174673 RepID=UPI001E8CFC94|nr:uncharacterized protein LAJ45_09317 [Morchella importuna]KAH8146634.1 hypothetical protein LAJ45_09317 [Morchella importuna]